MSWRDKDAVAIDCPYCGGAGKCYAEVDGEDPVRTFSDDEENQWKALPPERQGYTECPHCEGCGSIFEEEW